MTPQAGQRLGHYRLIEKVGEGGMGVVWKGEDTVLSRTVAIKVLPADRSRDEPSRERFLEEARAASSVSDARIVQVFEFGREGDLDFIVMEYVEGQPLRRLLRGQPLPPAQVVDIGEQVARAVGKAHRNGLLHRDLKPANILVTPEGDLKVVDFGLATLFTRRESTLATDVRTDATTRTLVRGPQRAIVGTLAYMSPEQTRGEKLDSRSDIFSLGVVLYEMTTGTAPFAGATTAELAAEIQRARPRPIHEATPRTPRDLGRSIHKALAARPGDRYQTMDDLAVDLRQIGRELESGSSPSFEDVVGLRARRSRWWVLAGVAASIVVVAVIASGGWRTTNPAAPQPVHRQITFTGQVQGAGYGPNLSEISPDGQFLAYVERGAERGSRLMVQDLAGGSPLSIFQSVYMIGAIGWTPDGTNVLATVLNDSPRNAPQTLMIPRLGGAPRQGTFPCHFSPSPDGRRVAGFNAGNDKRIAIVEQSTGRTSHLDLEGPFTWLLEVDWSPVDTLLLFLTQDEVVHAIWTIPAEGGTQAKILEEKSICCARWNATGSAIYYVAGKQDATELRKVEIDRVTGSRTAVPATVLAGLDIVGMSLASDGKRMSYVRRVSDSDLWLVTRREGGPVETRRLTSGTFRDTSPSVSPDGRRVAFVRRGDIHTMSLDGGDLRQLTSTSAREDFPAWSPDGKRIAFGSDEGGAPRVWTVNAEGGRPRLFAGTKLSEDMVLTWAPGSRILYQRVGNRNFHFLDPDSGDEARLIEDDTVGWAFSPQYSPDGKRVAVSWNRKQPEGGYGPGVWSLSLDGLGAVRVHKGWHYARGWSSDGAWIYAQSSEDKNVVRSPASGGEPQILFGWPFEERDAFCTPGPDESIWICEVTESSTDVWLAENFDPEVD